MYTSTFAQSKRIPFSKIIIEDDFWKKRLEMNAQSAIFYQWDQLEKQHNQDNFRILAGLKEGYRLGFFYCDSDLHKWADAAARILATTNNDKLSELMREYIDLVTKVQTEDGYLFTYNQFHFPNRRWENIQIEHELYCLGHLIEAATNFISTKEPIKYRIRYLRVAIIAADLLVQTFQKMKPKYTPGHQEIEIALIKLYRFTHDKTYLDLARKFIEYRGKDLFFGLRLIGQALNEKKHSNIIKKDMQKKEIQLDAQMQFFGGETKHQKEAPFLGLRSFFQFLSGRYHQQNKSVKRMKRPVGHAVRWGYLTAAMAMLYQEIGDTKILEALERTWNHLVQKQMFITGGIGSLGAVEGFGRDYELHSDYCYCETCAAIANILLNWELTLITHDAKYADLLEWQLYNAMSVGIALDGKSYLYRNLLESNGQLTRKEWFSTPCCPSNVSRIWASLGDFIYSYNSESIWVHQYIGNSVELKPIVDHNPINIEMDSKLPWEGHVLIKLTSKYPQNLALNIRIPSWCETAEILINGEQEEIKKPDIQLIKTGSDYHPEKAFYHSITKTWEKTTLIELKLPMKLSFHKSHPKVKANKNKVALSRGPIVYCLESIDNPMFSVSEASIDIDQSIEVIYDSELLAGINKLILKDKKGNKHTAIPYYSWANRAPSAMQVWMNY